LSDIAVGDTNSDGQSIRDACLTSSRYKHNLVLTFCDIIEEDLSRVVSVCHKDTSRARIDTQILTIGVYTTGCTSIDEDKLPDTLWASTCWLRLSS
jgi:hypothetical protein